MATTFNKMARMKVSLLTVCDSRRVLTHPARLLVLAAIFHLSITATIYGLGRSALRPGDFNADGIGASFAPDGTEFLTAAVELSEMLRSGAISTLFSEAYIIEGRASASYFGRNLGIK